MAASNAIGPLTGAAAAAGFGMRAPFFLTTAMMWVGALVIGLWVRETDRPTESSGAGSPGAGVLTPTEAIPGERKT